MNARLQKIQQQAGSSPIQQSSYKHMLSQGNSKEDSTKYTAPHGMNLYNSGTNGGTSGYLSSGSANNNNNNNNKRQRESD